KGERFTLIEPPLVPQQPVSPPRAAIVVLGLILALSVGSGVALLLEAVDTTVRGRRDIDALLPVAPLAVLPWIDTPAERVRRETFKRYSLIGAAVSVVTVVALAHLLYRPLDVIWAVAWRRLVG